MDYMHGIMYPEPFFSIGEDPNGARATRGLLLQIFAGLFVIYNVLNKNYDVSVKNKKNKNDSLIKRTVKKMLLIDD